MSNYTLPSSPPDEKDYEKPFDEVQADEERHEKKNTQVFVIESETDLVEIWFSNSGKGFKMSQEKLYKILFEDFENQWGTLTEQEKTNHRIVPNAINSIENK